VFDYYALIGPLIRRIDPERAHHLTIAALRAGIVPAMACSDDPSLAVDVWGLRFPNPIGLAAGFDKNAEVADSMIGQGFGFVEVGTVTPQPQSGNPRPRLFRLPEDCAVINRFGFNSEGLATVADRLELRKRRGQRGIVGGNVGPNRNASDPALDCARCVRDLAPLVDYLVVNVSSPNTPGLRALQRQSELARLLRHVCAARAEIGSKVPLLLKVAPDLDAAERAEIVHTVLAAGIDGLVATNTTIERPAELKGRYRGETGGLSGAPLFERSTEVLADFYRLTGGRLPLVGVGGVASGAQAYAKIRAGATLVQLYTALVYHGPALVGRIVRDLDRLLRRDGFATIADAVGADVPGIPRANARIAP
jgi:dihydroorotate dehydrogenase